VKLRPFLALLLLSSIVVFAQDTAPAAAAAQAAAAPQVETKTLWTLFKVGGWSMWPLALCSVATIGLAIYNGMNLRPSKFLRPDVFAKLRDAVRKYDIPAAKKLCEAQPCPITNIAHPGLDRIEENGEIDIQSVEKGMEEAATQEVASHMPAINYLSVIAVIAPMIGLLGTVSGMIKAFSNMATLGMGRPERLADNISEALITTASG
jgi:biopolymer transport protein ExbB